MPKAKILRRALRDLSEAHAWLENQKVGLGARFLDCIDAFVDEIAANPYRFALVYDKFRQGYEGRFRYIVYYTVGSEDQVFIHAIVHSSRNQDDIVTDLPP